MKQAVLVFAIALVITLAIGPAVINYLRKNEIRSEDSRNRTEMAHEQTEYPDNGRIYVHYRYCGGSHYRQYRDG